MGQPVRVETDRGLMPVGHQPGFHLRKIQNNVGAPIAYGSRAELVESSRGFIIEVAAWHVRIAVCFACYERLDVSTIFAEQRTGIVFRMTLQINRETLTLTDEQIGAGFRRSGDDAIAFLDKFILGQIVVSRVRHAPSLGTVGYDFMLCDF